MTEDSFIVGVNYPWRHYGQDFGTCQWGYRGLAGAEEELSRDFQEIAARLPATGKKVIRFFVFADGRSSPEFDAVGNILGYDEFFFRDFDSLLRAAAKTDLQLLPVLLDFRWCYPPSVVGGVQIAGRSDVISEAMKRRSFLHNALGPLLARYGDRAEIFAWDLMNEPEWISKRFRFRLRPGSAVNIESLRTFFQDCTEMIHRHARQPVTIGSARPQWLRHWRGLGLDLYQCHWYLGPWRLRFASMRARIRNLDKPCLVGEAPTAGTRVDPITYIERARRDGYAGVLFWSYRANDRASDFRRIGGWTV